MHFWPAVCIHTIYISELGKRISFCQDLFIFIAFACDNIARLCGYILYARRSAYSTIKHGAASSKHLSFLIKFKVTALRAFQKLKTTLWRLNSFTLSRIKSRHPSHIMTHWRQSKLQAKHDSVIKAHIFIFSLT